MVVGIWRGSHVDRVHLHEVINDFTFLTPDPLSRKPIMIRKSPLQKKHAYSILPYPKNETLSLRVGVE